MPFILEMSIKNPIVSFVQTPPTYTLPYKLFA